VGYSRTSAWILLDVLLEKGDFLMQRNKSSIGSIATLAILSLTVVASSTSVAAQRETVLHGFENNGTDAASPVGPLIFDNAGNLYGTSQAGGTHNAGAVFEFMPKAGGGWSEQVLYSFDSLSGGADGVAPFGGLVRDAAGHLYGTTYDGGAYNGGTVFELAQKNGSWTERVLHSFRTSGPDGEWPIEGLTLDAKGNLYGVTTAGGSTRTGNCDPAGCGTVFELTPGANGIWTEKILHSFSDSENGGDGGGPFSVPIFDAAGNLYGTTSVGGTYGAGTVFELTPTESGEWAEKILYSFGSYVNDGTNPYAGVTLDAAGNLYGTAHQGGDTVEHLWGIVFELTPAAGGTWTETVLHNFESGTDGAYPLGALVLDAAGNLYGTTNAGGIAGEGTAFELTPADGNWIETILADFGNTNGANPQSGLTFGQQGNLYGTTMRGGAGKVGVLFAIKP
jgi:uncharacterized repeat protein (TIGR03803 family)